MKTVDKVRESAKAVMFEMCQPLQRHGFGVERRDAVNHGNVSVEGTARAPERRHLGKEHPPKGLEQTEQQGRIMSNLKARKRICYFIPRRSEDTEERTV